MGVPDLKWMAFLKKRDCRRNASPNPLLKILGAFHDLGFQYLNRLIVADQFAWTCLRHDRTQALIQFLHVSGQCLDIVMLPEQAPKFSLVPLPGERNLQNSLGVGIPAARKRREPSDSHM